MSIAEDRTKAKTEKVVTYFVNGSPQQTTEHKLTVRAILTDAGFTPPEQYQLVRDHGHHTFDSLDEKIPISKDERFTALFRGPTPVS